MTYKIIRYPAGTKPGEPIPAVSVDDYCKMKGVKLEEYVRATATIYERGTYKEIRECLDRIAENPHCIETEWGRGRRSLIATRYDGRKFVFAIVRK